MNMSGLNTWLISQFVIQLFINQWIMFFFSKILPLQFPDDDWHFSVELVTKMNVSMVHPCHSNLPDFPMNIPHVFSIPKSTFDRCFNQNKTKNTLTLTLLTNAAFATISNWRRNSACLARSISIALKNQKKKILYFYFFFRFTDEQYSPPAFVGHVFYVHVELILIDIHYPIWFLLDE